MLDRAATTGVYDQLEASEITRWLDQNSGARFDLIAACDTLIYFGDLAQVLVPAARLLRPSGLVAFTVEECDTAPFRLTDSGRYAHAETHVLEVARSVGLTVRSVNRVTLRYEYGRAVAGLVVTMTGRDLTAIARQLV
jgi:predicted TPR repeat methyltransferase